MRNYYTSLDLQDGEFVGTVYDSSNNNVVYTTAKYKSQSQVSQDIITYLATLAPPVTTPTASKDHNTITNTVKTVSFTAQTGRRCCGR